MTDKQCVFLGNVARLVLYAIEELGLTITGGELLRTPEQQELYVKSGRSQTMNSKHLQKLAIDLYIIKNGQLGKKEDYKEMAEYWKSLNPNNVAGYDWGWDPNHFEMK